VRDLFRLSVSDGEWMAAATRILLPVLGGDGPGRWSAFTQSEDGRFTSVTADASDAVGHRMAMEFPGVAPADLPRRLARTVLTGVTAGGLWTEASRQLLGELDAKEAVAVSCMDDDGGLIVGRLVRPRGPGPRVDTAQAYALGRAVRTAYRARRIARSLRGREFAPAIVSPEGAILARDASAVPDSALDVIRAAVRARERDARSPREGVSRALWPHLVAGRWSLIDDDDDREPRRILVVRHRPHERPHMKLTAAEARTLELSIGGESMKRAGGELGSTKSTVYRALDRALAKLGARSVAEVVALVRGFPRATMTKLRCGPDTVLSLRLPQSVSLSDTPLTAAERAIVPMLLASESYDEIARRRRTSRRTVANQVASIYRKLEVTSRLELVIRVAAM